MSDSNVYTAERILSKRTAGGVTQYLIKWKGYSTKENTWEPVENILDRGLLTAFEKKTGSEKKSTSKSRRSSSQASRHAPKTSVEHAPEPRIEEEPRCRQPQAPEREEEIETDSKAGSSQVSLPEIETEQDTETDRDSEPMLIIETEEKQETIKEPTPAPTPTPTLTPIPVQNSKSKSKHESSDTPRITPTTAVHKDLSSRLLAQNDRLGSPKITENNIPKRVSEASTIPLSSRRSTILSTFITDVTVNDKTITICESKTNQGFFKEISRHSVAVDTAHANDRG